MTTASTGLLCWWDFHPLEWQLDSLHGLLCFVMAALTSPFKSKIRLEAENAVLRHQLIVLRRKLRGARQTRKQRSLVLHPAISLVSIHPEGPHGHPFRDAGSLASGRFSQLLALEVTVIGRSVMAVANHAQIRVGGMAGH
jgi:hypothetical protein